MQQVIVIGAGIVGLSCAWSAARRRCAVTLIDPDFEGDRASHGNAGGIAITECLPLSLSGLGLKPLKWLIDPLGPLSVRMLHAPRLLPWFLALQQVSKPENFQKICAALASLNDLCLAQVEMQLADIGLAHVLHKRGALTVYESAQNYAAEASDWHVKRQHGVRFHEVSKRELRDLEPNLAPVFDMGVMLEDWAHINDPKEIVTVLRETLRQRGVRFVSGKAVAVQQIADNRTSVSLEGGTPVISDKVVVATGAWSQALAKTVGDRVLLESERGYNTTLPLSSAMLSREVIFAERKFVATPLAVGLRIGGAAEFAGLTAAANYQRSTALLALAKKFLPQLNETNAKQWMGNRPATPDSLPVIGTSAKAANVMYAFGHGHLGLTQAAATGELIGNVLIGEKPAVDLAPFSIQRFAK
jgi:D-amino-acid dehydrogenase